MKKCLSFLSALLLTLVLCAVPVMAADSGSSDSEEAKSRRITQAEHRAIVCLRTPEGMAPLAGDSGDGLTWEMLMDVSGTVTAGGDPAALAGSDASAAETLMLVTSDSLSTEEIIAAAGARSDVLFAEPDYITFYDPEDSRTAEVPEALAAGTADYSRFQWALHNTGLLNQGTVGLGIGNTGGLTGSDSVVIAVMDTGIDYTNPDLQDRMVNLDLYPELQAETGCGRYGYNAVAGETASDCYDYAVGTTHGTHCAGIIAAADNGSGVSGVMQKGRLLSVRIFGKNSEYCFTSDTIRGYSWLTAAKKAGVNVRAVNCSFGGGGVRLAEQAAIQQAAAADIIAVYASGNSSADCDINSYSSSNTPLTAGKLTVNAMDSRGQVSGFSNYGRLSTDLFAPGQDILSTIGSLSVDFQAFTAALDSSRILVYNSFEEQGGSADTEQDVNPLTYHYWSETAADHLGAVVTADTTAANHLVFLGSGSILIPRPAGSDAAVLVTAPVDLSSDTGRTIYLGAACRTDADQAFIKVSYRKKDGTYTAESAKEYDLAGRAITWRASFYTQVPDSSEVDFEHFQMRLSITYQNQAQMLGIDSIGLGYGLEPYAVYSGTSMAAPMVTGAFGLLAAEYPAESGLQIAARLRGGTADSTAMEDLCRSGGYLNVAKAALDPNPVVESITISGGTAVLEGYFFGSQGSVTAGGKSAAITAWDDTSVTVTLPGGLNGLQEFVLTDAAGQHGRNYADLGSAADFTRLAVPSGGLLNSLVSNSLAALDGSIWQLGQNADGTLVLCRYDIGTDTWIFVCSPEVEGTVLKGLYSNPCVCRGALWFLSGSGLTRYDIGTGICTIHPYDPRMIFGGLVESGGKLYSFGGSATGQAADAHQDILEYDPESGICTKVGSLPLALVGPDVCLAGNTVYVVGGYTKEAVLNLKIYSSADLETFTELALPPCDADQEISCVVAPTGSGLILSGLVKTENGSWQDTWNFDSQAGAWSTSDRILNGVKSYFLTGCQTDGRFYVMGTSQNQPGYWFFRSVEIGRPAAGSLQIADTALTSVKLDQLSPVAGTVLTASVTPQEATVSYVWYAGNERVGEGQTYTVSAADAGKVITVAATGLGRYYGTVTSQPTREVARFRAEGFVENLYQSALGRPADSTGLKLWSEQLKSGSSSGASVAYGVLFSQEFKQLNLCDEHFVLRLYEALMGRGADAAGEAFWLGKLAGGMTREEVFNNFILSGEFGRLCSAAGILAGAGVPVPVYGTLPEGPCSVCGKKDPVTLFVSRLYQECLGREPEAKGLADWTAQLRTHAITGEQAAYGFIFSNEYAGKKTDNSTFVTTLYYAFFDREPDPAGFTDWLGQLAAGTGREQVFAGFTGSAEFASLCLRYGIRAN